MQTTNCRVPFSRPFTTPDMLEELAALERVLKSGQWTQGPEVEAFEAEAAKYLGCPEGHECVAVSSCTAGLYLLLRALGPAGAGEEVLVPDLTFAASANAAIAAGYKIRLVDVDERGVFPSGISAHGKTISVSYAGLLDPPDPCGCDDLVIHDQAHSFQPGAYRPLSAWSFYPTKNITAGEGGLVGAPAQVARIVRELRNHGRASTYQVGHAGALNFRMTDFQAALLRVQLRHLPEASGLKRGLEDDYRRRLGGAVRLPPAGVTHLFWIRHRRRDELQQFLAERGVQASIHYRPLSQLGVYGAGNCPQAAEIAAETLSLPWFAGMTPDQANTVVQAVLDGCAELSSKEEAA